VIDPTRRRDRRADPLVDELDDFEHSLSLAKARPDCITDANDCGRLDGQPVHPDVTGATEGRRG
jgi:hypothetical protein